MSTTASFRHETIAILTLVTALAFAQGCSSTGGGTRGVETPPSGASALADGQKVARVDVALDAIQLGPDVIAVAEQYEIARILDNRVREHLGVSLGDDGQLDVKVDVIGLRLRSNGTAIWWGFMAGVDWITVDVDVVRDGISVKRFQTGTSTMLGGFAFGGRSSRVGRMMKTLGMRIAAGI